MADALLSSACLSRGWRNITSMEKDVQRGFLAKDFGGQDYPLQVCESAAGYYLGTRMPNGEPYSRESAEYWRTREEAETALRSRPPCWIQRPEP
jgi:hypothetical protein